jgi:hypothetical protein
MNYIPDPIERGESSAERAYDDQFISEHEFCCDCGKIFDPDREGGTPSPDPYCMPVCGTCIEKIMLTYSNSRETALRTPTVPVQIQP